jgi:hypothetical protein
MSVTSTQEQGDAFKQAFTDLKRDTPRLEASKPYILCLTVSINYILEVLRARLIKIQIF